MKKFYLVIFNLFCLLLMEFIFGILTFDSFQRSSIINIIVFMIPVSIILTIITRIFNEKVNKIITYVMFSILGICYSTQFVYSNIFNGFFSLSLLKIADQPLAFAKTTFLEIASGFYGIVLLFIPVVLMVLYKKKILYEKNKLKDYIGLSIGLILSIVLFIVNINITKKDTYSMYNLYFNVNEVSINVERLGVLNTAITDLNKVVFGFNEKINETEELEKTDDLFNYDLNTTKIDFSSLSKKTKNSDIKTIDKYMERDSGTSQNKYTGIFKNKNLIYIVAESFSDIAVSEKLTPTLYKMVNSGFVFNNFYTPNNASTIGGEFQALTGLFADNSTLRTWRDGKNYFPYGLGTVFNNLGYKTYAYHNNSYLFQNRNVYLKSLGFNNFKGCYNGLEKLINCRRWPQSDVEMIESTMDDYLKQNKPFMTYYMTVSGHFSYSYSDNSIASKNRNLVENLNYSDEVKAYLATQIELDRALNTMIKKLEKAKKLDDTVIVLLADHYPYKLSTKQLNEVSSYKKDSVVEINHSNLIIWNNKLKTQEVNKASMSIDVLPTVLNLYGVKYDSRLIVGKDILSNEPGLAMMKNRSWVTDYGTYFSSSNSTIKKSDKLTKDYISNMNKIVANKMNISRLIIDTDYYKHVFK